MGRGKRTATVGRAGPALSDSGRERLLPDVLKPERVEIELLLAWSYSAGPDGRSALPEVGDVGQANWERVSGADPEDRGDDMVRFYTEGRQPFMTYPTGDLWWIRDHLKATAPPRCQVVSVDEERHSFVVRVSLPRE